MATLWRENNVNMIKRQNNINTLRLRQNGRHFANDIFNCIFMNENVWIPIKISLKFVPKSPIKTIPALVQIMAWRRPGDKPLSEPMMVNLLTHICVTRPQWVESISFSCDVWASDDWLVCTICFRTTFLHFQNDDYPVSMKPGFIQYADDTTLLNHLCCFAYFKMAIAIISIIWLIFNCDQGMPGNVHNHRIQ